MKAWLSPFLAISLFAASSGAADGTPAQRKIVVTLNASPEFEPDQICILTARAEGREVELDQQTRQSFLTPVTTTEYTVKDSTEYTKECEYRAARRLDACHAGGNKAPAELSCDEIKEELAKPERLQWAKERLHDCIVDRGETMCGLPAEPSQMCVAEAMAALSGPAPTTASFGAESGLCGRSFTYAPTDAHVMCRDNLRPNGGSATRRVAVLRLHAPYTAAPTLREVELSGNALVLTVKDSVRIPEGQLPASVLEVVGGDYAAGDTATSATNQMALRLVPRCGSHVLQFTGGIPLSENGKDSQVVKDYSLELSREFGAAEPTRIQRDLATAPPEGVAIPYSRTEGRHTLRMKRDGEITHEASWFGPVPPNPLRMLAKRVHLRWERHCASPWPADYCPEASLPDAGGACERDTTRDDAGHCGYVCPAGASDTAFELSQRVSFTARQPVEQSKTQPSEAPPADFSETWTDRVYHDGQTLTSYSPLADRHLAVAFPEWTRLDITALGREIDYVDVRSPGGDRFRIKPRPGGLVQLGMPGLSCADHVSYHLIGTRDYREVVVSVNHATIIVDPPRATRANAIVLAGVLGGGVRPWSGAKGFGDAPLGPVASFDLIVETRHAKVARGWPEFEFRAGLRYTDLPYRSRDVAFANSSVKPLIQTSRYFLVPLTAGLVFSLPAGFYTGAGLGMAFGRPVNEDERDYVPKQWAFDSMAHLGLHLRPLPLALEGGVELLRMELNRIRFDEPGGQPETTRVSAWPFLVTLRIRVGS